MTFGERVGLRRLIDLAIRARADRCHYCPTCDRWLGDDHYSPGEWQRHGRCRACAAANSRHYYGREATV